MRTSAPSPAHPGRRWWRAIPGLAIVAVAVLPLAASAADAPISMSARALVAGHVRVGAWSAVEVELANDGPAVSGELRLGGSQAGGSTYGALVELATGSKKRYLLYAQPSFFGRDIVVDLVAGGQRLATTKVPITTHDAYQPVVAIVAEDPGRIVPDVLVAMANPSTPAPATVALAPADLPSRVEAWSAIDRLVWQDVDSSRLDEAQVRALGAWLALGGRLVILGGSSGVTTLGGFPDDLLPFRPSGTVDAAPADIASLLGAAPGVTGTLPAIGGTLIEGSVLARSGDAVIAAERSVGQGKVAIVGVDPGQAGIGGTAAARALWRRVLPASVGAVINPLGLPDDSAIVSALNNLPAVGLPPVEQLLALLVAYIVLIGPVNYVILRRLDRREWAWLTMPLLIVVFSVGAFGLGRLLKGSDTIVNEIAIVRGASGAETGLGQVYVGVFSPSRRSFDVRIAGWALLSNPISLQQQGAFGQPLDILLGDPARLRGYEVGFGVLRGFRAETALPAPRVKADLALVAGHLKGTVANASDATIENAALIIGGSLQRLGDLAPGQTAQVDLPLGANTGFGLPLSERMFGSQSGGGDAAHERVLLTRRTVVDQLTAYNGKFATLSATIGSGGAVLLGWRSGPALAVDIGDEKAARVGESMYVLRMPVRIAGASVFPDELISHSLISADSVEAFDQGMAFSLGRGSMTVEFSPLPFNGEFGATSLALGMTQGDPSFVLPNKGDLLSPLPAEDQPAQDDPLAGGGQAGRPFDGLPDVQLFDRTTGLWMEFAHVGPGTAARIAQPERYLDDGGRLLIRFVNRTAEGQGSVYFTLNMSMEGSVR